jgi:hypothetical protein
MGPVDLVKKKVTISVRIGFAIAIEYKKCLWMTDEKSSEIYR